MTEPDRLSSDPESELERALLAAARPRAPGPARHRAVAAVTAALAATSATTGTAAAGAAVVAKSGAVTVAAWVAVAGAVGLGAIVLATKAPARPDPPPASVRVARPPAPHPLAPPAPAPGMPSPPEPAPAIPVAPAATPRAPVPVPSAGTATSMSAELALVEQARAALSGGDPARALSLLEVHATRFRGGAMVPEATVLRIEALVRAGDGAAARRAADAMLAADPSSPYAERVRSLVGENP